MENYDLTQEEQASLVFSRFDVSTDFTSEQWDCFPTMERILKAVQEYKCGNKVSESINKMVVLPSGIDETGKPTKPVLFGHDNWFVEWNKDITRGPRFNNLTDNIQFECKIACVAELWLLTRRSKLNSLMRKCANMTLIAETCQELGLLSLFQLNSERNAEILKLRLMDKITARSFNNYLLTLNTLTDLSNTPLKVYRFCCTKNFMEMKERDDSNQTYCQPFSIFSKNWLAFKNYFLEVDSKFVGIASKILDIVWVYIRLLEGRKKISVSSNDWYKYISSPDIQSLFKQYQERFPQDGLIIITSEGEANSKSQSYYTKRYWKKMKNLGIEYRIDLSKFFDKISQVFIRIRMAIQAFTGMRVSEALYIQFNSLIDDAYFGYVGVDSRLTKFAEEGGARALWAAPPWCKDIFDVGKRLALKTYQDLEEQEVLRLKISLNVRQYIYNGKISVIQGRANTTQKKSYETIWAEEIGLYISEAEVQEFYLLNRNLHSPERVREEVYSGAHWPLRSHQYRRSIAVHCKRLSLVGGQELSFQLKHMQRTQSDWYGDGGAENSIYRKVASRKLKLIWDKEFIEANAEKSVEIQSSESLFGKGGQLLMATKDKPESAKVYPSLKKAKSMAARSKSELKAIGNGMYCLNGQSCKMESIIQNSSCDPDCENFVGEKEAVAYWLNRYKYYKNLISKSIAHKGSEAQLEYLKLEQNSYKEMLDLCGVQYE